MTCFLYGDGTGIQMVMESEKKNRNSLKLKCEFGYRNIPKYINRDVSRCKTVTIWEFRYMSCFYDFFTLS